MKSTIFNLKAIYSIPTLCEQLNLISTDWFIAGGALFEKHKDVDIYFRNEDAYNLVASYFTRVSLRSTTFADTYTIHSRKTFFGGFTIQLIKKSFGTPQQIVADFDLNKSKRALLSDGTTYVDPTFHDDLYVNPDKFRYNTLARIYKYIKTKNCNLDQPKFIDFIHSLLLTPEAKVESYYENKTKTVKDALLVGTKQWPFLLETIINITETFSKKQRLAIYTWLIISHSEILTLTSMSLELQLLLTVHKQQKPTPELLRQYPEYFL